MSKKTMSAARIAAMIIMIIMIIITTVTTTITMTTIITIMTTTITTTDHLTLFIKGDDGDEWQESFVDLRVAVRAGNRVTLVYGGDRWSRTGVAVAIVNKDTREVAVDVLQARRIASRYSLLRAAFWGLVVVAVCATADMAFGMFAITLAGLALGLVAAEAMLHHLPVLATQVGGLQNVVVNGETGFLVPPNSPAKLAEKIYHFYHYPEAVTTMGESGYQRAIQNYTEERYVKDVEALYNKLLIEKRIT